MRAVKRVQIQEGLFLVTVPASPRDAAFLRKQVEDVMKLPTQKQAKAPPPSK